MSTRILSIFFETAHRISRLSTTILAIQPDAAGVIGVESGRSAGSTGLNLISRTLYPGCQNVHHIPITISHFMLCLLYTSDAADDLLCVDLGGRRIIKKKKKKT